MTGISWTRTTPADMIASFDGLGGALQRNLRNAAEDIGVRIRGAAAENAPVDTGRLRASLESRVIVDGSVLRVVIGTNLDYAAPMEFGTSPFMPPPSALRGWAGRVLGDENLAFPVALSISATGLDERRYLRDALEENIDWAEGRIVDAVEAAFEEAFG